MGDERAQDFARYTGRDSRFASIAKATQPERDAQKRELERVRLRIAGAVLAFFKTKPVGTEYHGRDLRVFLAGQCGLDFEPDSARRIACDLKDRGEINYRCIDRTKSLYRVLKPEPRNTGETTS